MNDQQYQTIVDGIKGIHKRLDLLNGRVYTHEKQKADKEDLEKVVREVRQNRMYIWKISLLLAAVVGGTEVIKWLM